MLTTPQDYEKYLTQSSNLIPLPFEVRTILPFHRWQHWGSRKAEPGVMLLVRAEKRFEPKSDSRACLWMNHCFLCLFLPVTAKRLNSWVSKGIAGDPPKIHIKNLINLYGWNKEHNKFKQLGQLLPVMLCLCSSLECDLI